MTFNPENKQEGEKDPQTEYADLLSAYRGKVQKLKQLDRQSHHGEIVDKGLQAVIEKIDKERNAIHKKLLALGERLGKDRAAVLIDIVRKDRTLKEFGLPEFSIMTKDDIIDTEDWHHQYVFNVDTDERLPADKALSNYEKEQEKNPFSADKVMIVFAIVPVYDYGEEEDDPPDYLQRQRRAALLAEKTNGELFEERDSGYHEATAKILGVLIPTAEFEKTISLIRNHPNQYRLGENFYQEEKETERILAQKAKAIVEEITGEPCDLKDLPELNFETEKQLANKVIVTVDDDENVFKSFVPSLLKATKGSAIFIPHTGQNTTELAETILTRKADVVLLDFHLAMGINGANVAEELKKRGFKGKIIGFSSDKRAYAAFIFAGALGAVEKSLDNPEWSLAYIADLLRKTEKG